MDTKIRLFWNFVLGFVGALCDGMRQSKLYYAKPERLSAQLTQPAFEKPPFRLLLRKGEGLLVGGAGFIHPAQPPAQLRPRRMRQVIAGQFATRQDGINQL